MDISLNFRDTSTNLPSWARIREPLRWDEVLDELENETPIKEDRSPEAIEAPTETEKIGENYGIY